MKASDIVIVGAPRSGTNMLRDVLTALNGVSTWPCDEINLIWRHGNRTHTSDELGPELATPTVRDYIRRQFDLQRKRSGAPVVVEKTCATSMRVEFARAVLPEAKYLFIVRDGIDAAVSAAERWNAPIDIRYTAKKARFVPPADLPYYGTRFVANRVRRGGGASQKVGTWWGPKPSNFRDLMAHHTLEEICALQWAACVESSRKGFASIDSSQLLQIHYESFVTQPAAQLAEIMEFLDLEGDPEAAASVVSSSSVGKGRASLNHRRLDHLEALVRPTLESFNYVC